MFLGKIFFIQRIVDFFSTTQNLMDLWLVASFVCRYADMQRIILEFIPVDFDDEQFLNPAIQNLIVIDYLM